LEGCNKEFETYCKDVTPGEGRLLACLYAYEDDTFQGLAIKETQGIHNYLWCQVATHGVNDNSLLAGHRHSLPVN
jgi:hypothetical protein